MSRPNMPVHGLRRRFGACASCRAKRVRKRRLPSTFGQCVKCLTCYRSCTYKAIRLNGKADRAFRRLRRLRDLRGGVPERRHPYRQGFTGEKITPNFDNGTLISHKADPSAPFIPVFCCSRSAMRAKIMAENMGLTLPDGLTVVESALRRQPYPLTTS
jgi:ferredoxin